MHLGDSSRISVAFNVHLDLYPERQVHKTENSEVDPSEISGGLNVVFAPGANDKLFDKR